MIREKVLLFFIIVNSFFIFSDDKKVLEFNNKPIRDVLMVLGDLSNKNLIPDDSINGICSYYFTTENIGEALSLFLKSQKLYITELDNAFRISKIYNEIDENLNISLKCDGTDINLVLNNLTSISGVTVLTDSLPKTTISLNINKLPLNIVLEIILKKLPDYILESKPDYYYIKKIGTNQLLNSNKTAATKGITINDNGTYSINLNNVRFSQVIKEFFDKTHSEYSVQGRNDNIIDRLEFKDKDFIELLTLILESGSCDYVFSNEIYYIFDIVQSEIANRHTDIQIIKLQNISTDEFQKLIPSSLLNNNTLKINSETNSIIVSGTNIKTEPIIKFIKQVDLDQGREPRWFNMNYASTDLFKTILLKTYSKNQIINVDDSSFLMLLTENEYKSALLVKNKIDIPLISYLTTLKYIKSEDLLDNLPKSVDKDQIVVTPNPSQIFFYGGNEAYNNFLRELEKIDKPVPQIKYKILVLQNTTGNNLEVGLDVASHSEDNGDISVEGDGWNSFSGVLGGLLGLNFNFISAFGALFSLELNAALNKNESKILVDTTLQALSGEKASFRNTTTSRFYSSTTDADGDTETGATQEVSWGIILEIEGWTSGDGMVTVNIESTISDETTVSDDSSGIPSTSEKVVKTEVRTREGVPVVISGLLSSKKEVTTEKVPLLGEIPLLGLLFTKTNETETESEFTIYLIPYIEDNPEENLEIKLETAYKEFL